jgi:hypothetical protein
VGKVPGSKTGQSRMALSEGLDNGGVCLSSSCRGGRFQRSGDGVEVARTRRDCSEQLLFLGSFLHLCQDIRCFGPISVAVADLGEANQPLFVQNER